MDVRSGPGGGLRGKRCARLAQRVFVELARRLRERGAEVRLNREDDRYVGLVERAAAGASSASSFDAFFMPLTLALISLLAMVGLFTLFFSEMWERFSFYGMRALLVFYMIKGFLSYSDDRAYGVYGAYTALVYATGFIGGWFADRPLGQRRAAVLGGLLMAGGQLVKEQEQTTALFLVLGLLVV